MSAPPGPLDPPQDLTLLDLPGVVGSSLQDQDEMPKSTLRLFEKYLLGRDTLVLVVAIAQPNLHNSSIFERVKDAGKRGQSLGVLTMVDKCDDETRERIRAKLQKLDPKEVFELGNGYVALFNRSMHHSSQAQQAGKKKPTIEDAAATEAAWFRARMPELADRTGIHVLVNKVTGMLVRTFEDCAAHTFHPFASSFRVISIPPDPELSL